ncbi:MULTISPECIES: helix-turn-helix domain-containing protein [Streptomyces]|uniref:helix-turn-helix domain-containing protein n=1 Tax=Streptomyces TaxID=1883 RepID=UPI0015C50C6A|nr:MULTISPECIES: helix-turn-helix transcriptional regulator [Streptomyces]MDX3637067.1 helix-turn-helix transcriptional regulator [Streptomyces europaeiscabiei]MDX3655211.1 helix-turn-helix transcriptional regulator [Streptomyces europaeiscabiei]WRZ53688.1 helix-turn-helix transcriptional regulator [Streptomyces sp. NBC_01314]
MPRSNNDQLPATYVASGSWPYARLVEDAPVSAYYGQAFARNLAQAMATAEIGLRALGDRAGVSHATISRLLRGMVLPDMGTLARLEAAMGTSLWPDLTVWTDRDCG